MAYCGIDVGTQGVRVAVVDPSGALLGSGAAELPASQRLPGRHEQDPDEWWAALADATRTATARAGTPIEAVCLDATSGTVLVEHADGASAGPALMYDDARGAEQSRRAQLVGARRWAGLGYRMQPTWALPKAMWLREHGALGRGDRIVHQSDHLVRRLVGAPVATDTSNALKTGADLRDATWPADVFAELGLDAELFLPLVWPGTVLGEVSPSAARATGLPTGATVRAGMTDGCASQIAAGALAPGSWSSALGTTLVVKGVTTELVPDPSGSVYSHRHPDGGWMPGGASSTGAGVLAREFAGADLDELTRATAGLVPDEGVTYPLATRGERFPFVAPDAVGFAPSGTTTAPERFLALCLGIAYVERLAYDVLGRLGADVSGSVAFTGGAARNAWWNQLRTDVLGRETLVPRSADAAVGMAVLAAAEPGRLADTAARMVRVAVRHRPDPERGEALHAGYERLVDALVARGWLSTDRASA